MVSTASGSGTGRQSPAGPALVGQRIKSLRRRLGLTQAELVAGLPLTGSYVSLIEAGRREPRQRALEMLAERLGCTVEFLLTGRGRDGLHELDLELRFAELALRSGDPQVALERYAAALVQAERGGHADAAVEASWGLARARKALGDVEGAIEGLEQLATGETLMAVSRVAVLTALCHSYNVCGDLDRAIEVGERALAEAERCAGQGAHAPDRDELAELASTLAGCYYERGDLTRAHLLVRRVIDDAERANSPRARAAAYWNAGLVADARGDRRAARAHTERALALYAEGDNARAIAALRVNCAWLMLRAPEPDRDPAEAARLLERAIGELTEVGTPTDVACAETELARCHLLAGDLDEAAAVAWRALDRLAGAPRLEAAKARVVLAEVQLAMGAVEAAVEAYGAAAADLAQVGASRQAAIVWRELADALVGLGRTDAAMAAYRSAADAAGIPASAFQAVRGTAAAATPQR
ncbi:MAG: tetratricopeptide repeat protein [Frankiaceae bacterium]